MDDSDEHYKQCYLLIHLNKRSFFDRLMYAIDYILGRQSKYGAFDEVVLDEEGMNQIINYLEKIKKQ